MVACDVFRFLTRFADMTATLTTRSARARPAQTRPMDRAASHIVGRLERKNRAYDAALLGAPRLRLVVVVVVFYGLIVCFWVCLLFSRVIWEDRPFVFFFFFFFLCVFFVVFSGFCCFFRGFLFCFDLFCFWCDGKIVPLVFMHTHTHTFRFRRQRWLTRTTRGAPRRRRRK